MADLTKYRPADPTTRKSKQDIGSEIDAFVERTRAMQVATRPQRGRLIFALDATASRQPTWDMACQLQAEMFWEVSNLDVQLVFYRGLGECRASGWVSSGERLANLMSGIICRAGQTQIGKILAHARSETEKNKVEALVFVGDAMEENLDELVVTAAELGREGLKAFMFQEGDDPQVEDAFRQIAQLTRGAYCRFDAGAPRQLAELSGQSLPTQPAGSRHSGRHLAPRGCSPSLITPKGQRLLRSRSRFPSARSCSVITEHAADITPDRSPLQRRAAPNSR